MKNFLSVITLNMVISVLLVLVAVWLIVLIIRKERAFLTRAILLLLFLLSIHLYLNFSSPSTLTFADLKDYIFPPKPLTLDYTLETRYTPEATITRYIFKEPLPRISVSMDKDGKFMHIEDIRPINRILRELNLPEVKEGAPELVSLTGSRIHISHYRWEKYSRGVMIMEKTLCQDRDGLESYPCLVLITIRSRY